MSPRRPFIGGNWKMNTNRQTAAELTRAVVDGLAGYRQVETAIFPPFPYLLAVKNILRERGATVKLGAQDVYFEPDGAFTGEVSVDMLRDCGVEVVLCGHSERRHVLGEGDGLVNRKVRAVLGGGLECVLCCGETLDERLAGATDSVNERQLRAGLDDVTGEQIARLTIAYEPVWAIGTGKTATPQDAQAAHQRIRALLALLYGEEIARRTRIQYGGSLKPSNAADLFAQPDVDGGLVGGASLKAQEFVPIVRAAAARL